MIEDELKIKNLFKKREEITCEFCQKKYINIGSHKVFCKKNPNHRKSEQCPYCNKYFMKLEFHLTRCKRCPEVQRRQIEGSIFERSITRSIYIQPSLLELIKGSEQTKSKAIREAISNKIKRERNLPLIIGKPVPSTIGIKSKMIKQIKNIINKGYALSVSEFIRIAIIEELVKLKEGSENND